mgnify:FL=1|jgi:hypothetical protein
MACLTSTHPWTGQANDGSAMAPPRDDSLCPWVASFGRIPAAVRSLIKVSSLLIAATAAMRPAPMSDTSASSASTKDSIVGWQALVESGSTRNQNMARTELITTSNERYTVSPAKGSPASVTFTWSGTDHGSSPLGAPMDCAAGCVSSTCSSMDSPMVVRPDEAFYADLPVPRR